MLEHGITIPSVDNIGPWYKPFVVHFAYVDVVGIDEDEE